MRRVAAISSPLTTSCRWSSPLRNVSTITLIGPGPYWLVATGTGVRDSSLDVTLSVAPVPEPDTVALLRAGLVVVGFMARRRG